MMACKVMGELSFIMAWKPCHMMTFHHGVESFPPLYKHHMVVLRKLITRDFLSVDIYYFAFKYLDL